MGSYSTKWQAWKYFIYNLYMSDSNISSIPFQIQILYICNTDYTDGSNSLLLNSHWKEDTF